MPDMFESREMLQRELIFTQGFTVMEARDYGVLFYNQANPKSHDSNHALILNLESPLEPALADIIRFYRDRRLIPRIYASFMDKELEILGPLLLKHGFTVETRARTYFRLNPGYTPAWNNGLVYRRITVMSPEIEALIYSDGDGGEWTVKVIREHLKDPGYHLLGVYDHNRLMSMASVKFMDGYSRVDDVETHQDFRGCRYGANLINYLISYHAGLSGNHLYLYASNPIAIRMYNHAGFQEVPLSITAWTAWLDG